MNRQIRCLFNHISGCIISEDHVIALNNGISNVNEQIHTHTHMCVCLNIDKHTGKFMYDASQENVC